MKIKIIQTQKVLKKIKYNITINKNNKLFRYLNSKNKTIIFNSKFKIWKNANIVD